MRLVLIAIAGVILLAACSNESQITGTTVKNPIIQQDDQAKSILFIVAQQDFRDEELRIPKEMFDREGHTVTIASPKGGIATGMKGMSIETRSIKELVPDNYDIVAVIGGAGSQALADIAEVTNFIKSSHMNGKVIGGICLGPITLARAGVLKDKQATVFLNADSILALEEGGAIITAEEVVVDGRIVTANGPKASENFAKALLEVIE
ncbi:MAG: DJ-1/PfpI family protein [Candidatus Woesearchaeota archaeon]